MLINTSVCLWNIWESDYIVILLKMVYLNVWKIQVCDFNCTINYW